MTYYLKWSLEEKPVLGLDFSNSNFNNLFWGKTFIHFQPILLEWVKVAQSCLTLCDPMDCSPPGSSVHGILQARILEWVAMPSSRGSSQPRDQNPGLVHCREILFLFSFNWRLITLQYCSGFCHYMHQPWVYICSQSWTPLPPPSPSHPSGSSQCSSPEHPISCIRPGLAIYFTYSK